MKNQPRQLNDHDRTHPREGQYYRIRCVRTWSPLPDQDTEWTPIFGPLHSDADPIAFETPHWHIDWRFVSEKRMKTTGGWIEEEHITTVISVDMLRPLGFDDEGWEGRQYEQKLPPGSKTAWSRIMVRKCHRGYFGTWHIEDLEIPWMKKLEAQYQGVTLGGRNGWKCPHKGVDLSQISVHDGVVECPLHGLRWCTRTRTLIQNDTK